MTTLAKYLKYQFRRCGKERRDIERMGVSASTVDNMLYGYGNQNYTLATICLTADGLGVPRRKLFDIATAEYKPA